MSKKKGQTKVTIYPDWCKGCGICIAFCPAKVFVLGADGKSHVAHEDECVGCGFCELHCPDFAVSVTPRTAIHSAVPSRDVRAEPPAGPCNPDPGPEPLPSPTTPEVEHGNQKA
ncbi:MAG: 4Fe-4S dicluster domain-containing protein [Desulfovibrionales bacterium]|nr:4Fe-4S dicluster domain-containing protein [Desulfovibrionales bacterium]